MKKTLFFALALATLGVLPFCTKDPVPNGNDIVQTNDTIPQTNDTIPQTNDTIPVVSNTIVFGQTDGMRIKTYESHSSMHLSLDLNENGWADLEFISENVGSAGLGHDIVTTLKCKHEKVVLLGDVIQQERYLHTDSTFYTQDSVHWTIGVNLRYTCDHISETDSLLSITEKLSNIDHSSGDSFGPDDSFMKTEVYLKNWSYQYPGGYETIGDTTYYWMIYQNNDCDYFPMDEEKYIGFKIIQGDRERLGWIKFILHYDCVELIETAIQQ